MEKYLACFTLLETKRNQFQIITKPLQKYGGKNLSLLASATSELDRERQRKDKV
jgi:hypothetical protein